MTYRKSILLYAYAIPIAVALVLAVVVLGFLHKFKSSQNEKILDYQVYDSLARQVMGLEAKIREKDSVLRKWREALSTEFRTSLNTSLQETLKNLDGRQLEQSSFATPTGGNGLSLPGGQPVSRVQLEFRGGFEPMQSTLLVLEGRLPQMQLESSDIQTDTNGEGLRFVFTYSAWEQSNR